MRFVLVHGAHHGAWCWDKLVPELEKFGYSSLAITLPGCDTRTDEPANVQTWRAALRDVVEDGDILVGHSMGGFAISLAADEVPDRVGRLIYLSAAVPVEGGTMGEATATTTADDWPSVVGMPYEDFIAVEELPHLGLCVRFTKKEAANKLFYHDCRPKDQDWAWEHLTPLPVSMATERFFLPNFWNSSIPRDLIVSTEDHSHPVAMDNVFMRRLGLSSAFSIVSSHSPFISCPAETAKVLNACARGTLS